MSVVVVDPITVLGWLLVGFFASGGLVAFFFVGMLIARIATKKEDDR